MADLVVGGARASLRDMSLQFLNSFRETNLEDQCRAVASLTSHVPRKFWDSDEGRNLFLIVGQTPRLTNAATRLTDKEPEFTQALTAFVRRNMPEEVPFTAVSVRTGPGRGCHRDLRNSFVPSMIVGLSDFSGGRLWIECPEGKTQGWTQGSFPTDRTPDDISYRPVLFSSRALLHGTEKWSGPERKILTAFTPQLSEQAGSHFSERLAALGFVPLSAHPGATLLNRSTFYGHRVLRQLDVRTQLDEPLRTHKRPLETPTVFAVSSDEEDCEHESAKLSCPL